MVARNNRVVAGTFTANGNFQRWGTMPLLVDGCTEVLVRFSLTNNGYGLRVERRLAVNFADNQWLLVTSNLPVSFLRNYRYPQDGLSAGTREQCWSNWTVSPETLHVVTMLMSERGIPASYRHLPGYSVSIFAGDAGQTCYLRFHLKSEQGIATLTEDQVESLAILEADSWRDLTTSIEAGQFPCWRLCVQVVEGELPLDDPLFDTTRVWPQKDYPLTDLGVLKLTHCVTECAEPVFEVVDNRGLIPVSSCVAESNDNFMQVGTFFRILSSRQRQALFDNTARGLHGLSPEIKLRHTVNCLRADIAYGQGLANALGIPLSKLED